jgi:hypothetical protein
MVFLSIGRDAVMIQPWARLAAAVSIQLLWVEHVVRWRGVGGSGAAAEAVEVEVLCWRSQWSGAGNCSSASIVV